MHKGKRHLRQTSANCLAVAAVWLALGAIVSPALTAQVPAPPTPPAGLKVELRIGDGIRTSYHVGELVPFTLTFSATDHTPTWISAEPCDTPDAYPVTDPPDVLAPRNANIQFGCTTHGFGNDTDLAEHPWVRSLVLNRQYRLDKPGTYEFKWSGSWFGEKLTSNVSELTLLPATPAWQAQELARAIQAIDIGGKDTKEGCEMLAYLDTPESELEMARRFGFNDPCHNTFKIALENARDREAVLRILEAKIGDPNEIIGVDFLRTAAQLSLYSQHPEWYTLAMGPWPTMQAERVGPMWHPSLLRDEQLRYARKVVAALPGKQPYVRAMCIFNLTGMVQWPYRDLPDDISAALKQQMPPVFRNLSEGYQRSILTRSWEEIASPAMIPVLVDIVRDPNETARAEALKRLNEIAPDKAQPFVLDAIRSPQGGFQVADLMLLPDKELPEFDEILLKRVEENLPNARAAEERNAIALLRRYASAAIEPNVRSIFGTHFDSFDCEEQFDFMEYLHRVNPAAAESFFSRLQFGTPPKCSLRQLAKRYWSPKIEAAEIALLDGNNPHEIEIALHDLQMNASPVARAVILQHFQAWNAKWKPQATTPQAAESVTDRLDSSYLRALIFAYGWNTTQLEIEQIGELCITDNCRNEAKQRAAGFYMEHTMIALSMESEDRTLKFGIAPYGGGIGDLAKFEKKVLQYPRGTSFQLDTRNHHQATVQQVVATLGAWMTEHGYTLTLYREPPMP